MRFIDEVLSADDQGARSRTVVRSDTIAVDDEGRFPALALIEVMAQTIGIYAGRVTVFPQGDESREEPAGRALLNVFNPPEGYFDHLK